MCGIHFLCQATFLYDNDMTQPEDNPVPSLIPPQTSFRDGILRSDAHQDIYFSTDGGLAETDHVFFANTGLDEALASRPHITIAETGFGTGLNFLAVLARHARLNSRTRIDYISFEAHPLAVGQAKPVWSAFPELAGFCEQLAEIWPDRWPGCHHRLLAGGMVHLHLHHGDAQALMTELDFAADIWFLDGFSPDRNPGLWSDSLFAQIARLSAPDTRLASFTVAAKVRAGLAAAGFEIEKRPGFGRKRHCLAGWLGGKARRPEQASGPVAIIGGGIAGASMAAGCRAAGLEHLVIEASDHIASGASGNPAGLQGARLRQYYHPAARLSVAALSYARQLARQTGALICEGSLSLDWPAREAARLEKLAAAGWPDDLFARRSSAELSRLAGLEIRQPGAEETAGQLIDPPALCRALLADSPVRLGAGVTGLTRLATGWAITLDGGGQIEAGHIVLCAGAGLPLLLEQLGHGLPGLQITTGQISLLASGSALARLAMPLHFGGYLTPPLGDGRQILGASFDHAPRDDSKASQQRGHQHNLGLLPADLRQLVPDPSGWQARISQRLASPDRMPLAGPFGQSASLLSALGARGLTLAPLLGLVLARQLAGRPAGLDRAVLAHISPMRLAARDG